MFFLLFLDSSGALASLSPVRSIPVELNFGMHVHLEPFSSIMAL